MPPKITSSEATLHVTLRYALIPNLWSTHSIVEKSPSHSNPGSFPDSLVVLGINGHFYLGGIEEEVLGRALHGARVLLLFLRCRWLCKVPQRASNFYSLARAKLSIETGFLFNA